MTMNCMQNLVGAGESVSVLSKQLPNAFWYKRLRQILRGHNGISRNWGNRHFAEIGEIGSSQLPCHLKSAAQSLM